MKTMLSAMSLVGLMLLATALTADEKQKDEAPKPLCPVEGGPIDKSVSADYLGGKVYFCCPACIPKFNADKGKYATKANLQLVLTGQAKQTACPLSGGKTNPKKTTQVAGVEIQFCCGNCQGKVAKAKPEEQMEMVFGKGFAKAFTVAKK